MVVMGAFQNMEQEFGAEGHRKDLKSGLWLPESLIPEMKRH